MRDEAVENRSLSATVLGFIIAAAMRVPLDLSFPEDDRVFAMRAAVAVTTVVLANPRRHQGLRGRLRGC